MLLPESLEAKDRSVEISVGGPGFGEGVFVIVGKAIAIGIDCCSSFFQKHSNQDSFLESKLSGLEATVPLVWVLTHYHYDHFHCLPRVLAQFSDRLKALLFPNDYTPADVSFVMEQRNEFPNSKGQVYKATSEYRNLRDLIKLPPFNRIQGRLLGMQPWFSIDLKLQTGEVVKLRIRSFSPDSDVHDELVGVALNNVMDEGTSLTRTHANRGSYILYFQVGDFCGLFLGDAGCERVDQLIASEIIGQRGIDCLKVGHHGSLDATNERLLEICGRRENVHKEQHAVIAPYRSAGLPNPAVIRMLKEFGFTVHLCDNSRGSIKEKGIGVQERFLTKITVDEEMSHGADIVNLELTF